MKPRKLKNVRVPNRGLLSSGDRSHRKKDNTRENSTIGDEETPRETTTSEKLKAANAKKQAMELEDDEFKEHVRQSLDDDEEELKHIARAVKDRTLLDYVKRTITQGARPVAKPPLSSLNIFRPGTQ